MIGGPPPPLPPLRQDLRILRGAPMPGGAPGWVVFDPVRHRYFQVGRGVLDMLQAWAPGPPAAFAERMRRMAGRLPSPAELEALLRFLVAHELVESPEGGRALAGRQEGRRHHWLTALVHNYLFFRIPLVRPQAFLDRTRWVADILFSPALLIAAALCGLVGALLAGRQWDTFAATGMSLLSLEGAAVYAVCLPLVKTLHELGHAWMATRYGVRVPTMGVAFMVMAPFLYSDVTDAWRLTSRRQRLAIDAAGLLVELMLAAVSLLVWVFLPSGPLRTGVFVLGTTSLVMGLLLNLNPFMRFDGYHILADAVGVPNLQTRSMAVGRWLLRELLFGVGAPCPEPGSRRTMLAMALYAWAIWIYRLVLFLGIAVLVYHMAFKALGIVLFAIEIVWFIALPIVNELVRWWKGRALVARRGRARLTLGLAGAALVLACVPLPTTVSMPVVAGARREASLYPQAPGRIAAMAASEGQAVEAGQELLRLEAPDLDAQVHRAELRRELVQLKLARVAADKSQRNDYIVLLKEAEAAERAIEGLLAQRADLVVRAPFAGRVVDLDPVLRVGLWVSRGTPLASVVAPGAPELRGYVSEADLRRIAPGDSGRFVPDDPLRAGLPVRIEAIGTAAVETIDIPALSGQNEGPVAVAPDPSGRTARPLASHYPVTLLAQGDAGLHVQVRGHASVRGSPESVMARLARQVIGVLIRESGA